MVWIKRKGIKEKDIRDFVKYAEKLNDVMGRILEYNPEATLCLNTDELQLVGVESFGGGDGVNYNEENVVASVQIRNSSVGKV